MRAFHPLVRKFSRFAIEDVVADYSTAKGTVATLAELERLRREGRVKKFSVSNEGKRWCERTKQWVSGTEGFATVNTEGEPVGFLNRCPHVNLELDMEDSRMFSRDLQLLQCKVHGALFEIGSGEGLGGPCRNQALTRLELTVDPEGNVAFTGSILPRVAAELRPKELPRRKRQRKSPDDSGEDYFDTIAQDLESKVASADARLVALTQQRLKQRTEGGDQASGGSYTAWMPK